MSREAMQQALDALESIVKEMRVTPAVQGREYVGLGIQANNSIDVLRAALAEQPDSSVMANGLTEEQTNATASVAGLTPAAPVLTDAEIEKILAAHNMAPLPHRMNAARAILAAAIPPGSVVVPVGEVEALRKALESLYGVVIDHNRSGARWERELFGRMMQSLADAKQALAARPGGQG